MDHDGLHHFKAKLEADTDYTFSYEISTNLVPWGHRMDHFNKISNHLNHVFHRQLIYTSIVILVLSLIGYGTVGYYLN